MKKILMAVRKISDMENSEVEYYFQCLDCGSYLFYCEVPDDSGWCFHCSNCGKTYTHL